MEILTELFGNFVFPIAISIALIWYCWLLQKSHKEEIESIRTYYEDRDNRLTEAIENNTKVIGEFNVAIMRFLDKTNGKE